jgi:glycosyltransferase involved in cell wall biosynthesis
MRILCIANNTEWCWTTTAREIAARLPRHEIDIRPPAAAREHDVSGFDLVWFRGYTFVCERLTRAGKPYAFGFVTGGIREATRMDRCLGHMEAAAGVLVQNSRSHEAVRRVRSGLLALIPNGVDTAVFHPGKAPDDFVVGMAANVGTVDKWGAKGADTTLAACSSMGVRLRIASPRLPNPAPDVDHFQLAHAEMPGWYRRLSVLAQPSLAEGCSNSVMEAMATGLPCVISREAGYHGEVCRDARQDADGEVLFVAPGDWAGMLSALQALRADRELRERCGANARRFAGLHGWDGVARLHGDFFEACLS